MPDTLIPPALLEKPGKILFITHLAIGDYAYLHNFFQALAAAHPQLEMHIWVDELRRTANPKKWNSLKKYALYDWLAACPFFKKIYNQTYSPALNKKSIAEARAQNYAIVVSLTNLHPHRYAALARRISPDGFVAGIAKPRTLFTLFHQRAYKKLDASIAVKKGINHITELYADWFERLFGLRLPHPARFPLLEIPAEWKTYATDYLRAWGAGANPDPLVFINTTAKTKKRCWPMAHALSLINAMQQQQDSRWKDAWFLLNAMPSDFAATEAAIAAASLPRERVRAYSASDNFFQLPAMLAECDLIISVETAIMHLANAVRVPVIALMRQKNPEWKPIDTENSTIIMPVRRNDWVNKIPVAEVMRNIQ